MVAKMKLARNLVSVTLCRSPTVPSISHPWKSQSKLFNFRRIRMRPALQVHKCDTEILSRTQARGNLLRDRKRGPSVKDPSQFDHIATQYRIDGQSLRNVRRKLGRPKEDKMERVDTNAYLGNIYDCVNEGSGASRKILSRKFMFYEEYQII